MPRVILLEQEIGLPAAFDLTLEDWQELWRGKRGRLGPEEQRGLLGEIIVLSSLIQHNKSSIHSWVGPLRELHDFAGRKAHLEIKTTARQPPSVFISEVGQVAPFQGEDELHLILVLQLGPVLQWMIELHRAPMFPEATVLLLLASTFLVNSWLP